MGKWIARKKTPPEYGESPGPMIVACQWNCAVAVVSMARSSILVYIASQARLWAWAEHTRSSPIGPALHDDGGSLAAWSVYFPLHSHALDICIPAEICEFLVKCTLAAQSSLTSARLSGIPC